MQRRNLIIALTLIAVIAPVLLAENDAKKDAPTIQGMEAIRMLFRTGKINDAEQFIYVEQWDDIRQPEAMHIRAQIIMRKNQRDIAATWYNLLLRIADDYPSVEGEKFRSNAEKFLKFGDRAHEKDAVAYLAQAGGKFPGPEKVGDGWMTQVSAADLHGLKALQAWFYIEGRPQVLRGDSMWIHTQKSAMHRSGLKWTEEVSERNGALFGVAHAKKPGGDEKKGPADINKEAPKDGPPAATRITYTYPGKGTMLRIGTRMWGSAFRLEVKAGDKTILEQLVEGNSWSDLSAELPSSLKKGDKITVDLILPSATNHIHGVWIDYIDVFED